VGVHYYSIAKTGSLHWNIGDNLGQKKKKKKLKIESASMNTAKPASLCDSDVLGM
jgi:hypothetical protein